MKKCRDCGWVCQDIDSFCSGCGSKNLVALTNEELPGVPPDAFQPIPNFTAPDTKIERPLPKQEPMPNFTAPDPKIERPLPRQDTIPKKRKKNTNRRWLAVALVLAVLAAVVLYFALRPDYVEQMMTALREGDGVKAVDIYHEHIIENDKRKPRAQSEYLNWLSSLRDGFERELINYQEMQNQLAIAKLITLDPDAWQAVADYIDNLHQTREKIQEAARAYKQGDYLSAMAICREVLEAGQFLQEEATAGLESSIDGYRSDIISTAEKYAEAGDFARALAALQEGLANLPEDELLVETELRLQETWSKAIAANFRQALAAGNNEQAAEFLSEGLRIFPDNELLRQCQKELAAIRDYNIYTPWEIITIFDGELTDSSRTRLGDVQFKRPVFQADYEHADKFNAEFNNLTFNPQLGKLTEPATAETVKGLFSDEVEEVQLFLKDGHRDLAFFYSREEWQQKYRIGPIVSFQCISDVMRCGAIRPSGATYGRTFNLETGEVLQLTDFLLISPAQQVETIYKEHVAYQKRHSSDNWHYENDPEYISEIKSQCGEDIVFWLEEDGIHIHFFVSWAEGDEDLIIPYTRSDLLQPQFVIQSDDWKEAYLKQLKYDADGIKRMKDSVEFSIVGSAGKRVAFVDICGDSSPEFIYMTFNGEAYRVFVWGYEGGLVPLVDGAFSGAPFGGGCSFGIAVLKGGKLMIMHEGGSEAWTVTSEIYECRDGKLALTEKMVYLSGPDYETGGSINEYTYNDKKISEGDYTSKLNSWLAEIEVPLFASADHDSDLYKRFVSDYAMSYEEATAFLKQ